MMNSQVVLGVLLLSVFSLANETANEKANRYFDNFLSTAFASEVRQLELDPANLPEFDIEFEEHVKMFGKVKGKAEFKEGTMEGLSEAQRQSNCSSWMDLSFFQNGWIEDGWITLESRAINCTIRFDELKVRYEGKLKYGRIPKMSVKGKAKVSNTQFRLEIVQQNTMQPILKDYACTQMGSMKVKFTGLGPLNRFMNVLEEAYLRQVKHLITSVMSQKLQYAINRAIAKDLLLF